MPKNAIPTQFGCTTVAHLIKAQVQYAALRDRITPPRATMRKMRSRSGAVWSSHGSADWTASHEGSCSNINWQRMGNSWQSTVLTTVSEKRESNAFIYFGSSDRAYGHDSGSQERRSSLAHFLPACWVADRNRGFAGTSSFKRPICWRAAFCVTAVPLGAISVRQGGTECDICRHTSERADICAMCQSKKYSFTTGCRILQKARSSMAIPLRSACRPETQISRVMQTMSSAAADSNISRKLA